MTTFPSDLGLPDALLENKTQVRCKRSLAPSTGSVRRKSEADRTKIAQRATSRGLIYSGAHFPGWEEKAYTSQRKVAQGPLKHGLPQSKSIVQSGNDVCVSTMGNMAVMTKVANPELNWTGLQCYAHSENKCSKHMQGRFGILPGSQT